MQRIDTPSARTVNGRKLFTAGDPLSGIPPTVLSADWANSIQEELANLLEKSGRRLNSDDNAQLYQLLQPALSPPRGFADFFDLRGGEVDSPIAFCESDYGAIIVCYDGTIKRITGLSAQDMPSVGVTLDGWVAVHSSGPDLQIAHLKNGTLTIYSWSDIFIATSSNMMSAVINYKSQLNISSAPNYIFGAEYAPDGTLYILLPGILSNGSGTAILAAVSPNGVCTQIDNTLPINSGTTTASTCCLRILSDDHILFAVGTNGVLNYRAFKKTNDAWSVTSSGAVEGLDDASATFVLGGKVDLRWRETSNKSLIVFAASSRDAYKTGGVEAPLPDEERYLDFFSFGDADIIVTRSANHISMWKIQDDGRLEIVQRIRVNSIILDAAALLTLALRALSSRKFSLVTVTERFVVLNLFLLAFASSSPIYGDWESALCDAIILPVSSSHRLIGMSTGGALVSTSRLF